MLAALGGVVHAALDGEVGPEGVRGHLHLALGVDHFALHDGVVVAVLESQEERGLLRGILGEGVRGRRGLALHRLLEAAELLVVEGEGRLGGEAQ